MQILLGCDPEVFVRDVKNNRYISGHDLVPGTKAEPYHLSHGMGAVQVDGTALEFNISPAANIEDWLGNIDATLGSLDTLMGNTALKRRLGHLEIAIDPTADFDEAYFKTLPDTATELGCTPDFNAYTEKQNEPPHTDRPFRTASGHVHVGWTEGADVLTDENHFKMCLGVVKALDAVLFPVSLLWDGDHRRRGLYGAVGAFRPKSYGVEYRVLSNAWLRDTRLQAWVFFATRKVMAMLEKGEFELDDYMQYFRTLAIEKGGDLPRTTVLAYYEMLVGRGFPALHKDFLE